MKKSSLFNRKSLDTSALVEFIQTESVGPVSSIIRTTNSTQPHGAVFIARSPGGENVFQVRKVDDSTKPTVADKIREFASTLGVDLTAAEELIAAGLTLKDACDALIEQAADQRRIRSNIPDLLSVERLLELHLVKPKAYIENLLHEGETVAIAGRPKAGKSRLVMQAALSLVNGTDFLANKILKPATVLMIDFENRVGALSERFRLMNGSKEGYKRLHIWSAQSLASELPDGTPEGKKRLAALVEQVRPDVLIIDPWRLWLDGDENSALDVVRGLKILAGLRDRLTNLAIVIVHHVRKEKFENPRQLIADPSLWSDSLSGHHALMSHVDACFGLERSDDLIVFGGIARNAEPSTLILDEDESLRFQIAGNEAAALKVMTDAQAAIWKVATSLRKFTFTTLLKKAQTTNRKAVIAALRTAENHGLISRNGDQYIIVNPKVG